MKSFEHLIITRFNLNLYARDKHDAPTRTERWLAHRFEVFERYCLPSVAAQTNPNFRWLCLFDAATPRLTAAASAVTSPSVRSSVPYFTALGRPDA